MNREIGDLLFVYKYLLRNKLVAHRASIVQTKYTSGTRKSWTIDTAQYDLMSHWPKFQLISPARFHKIYDLKPKACSWATYGFIGPNAAKNPLFFSSKRMLRKYPAPPSTHFSFNLNHMHAIWLHSTGFLSKFLQNLIGENLLSNTNIKDFVDDLYKTANLLPDPPGECEWNNREPEDKKSFGIIEFRITEKVENERG
jgi:hypothetical protein